MPVGIELCLYPAVAEKISRVRFSFGSAGLELGRADLIFSSMEVFVLLLGDALVRAMVAKVLTGRDIGSHFFSVEAIFISCFIVVLKAAVMKKIEEGGGLVFVRIQVLGK